MKYATSFLALALVYSWTPLAFGLSADIPVSADTYVSADSPDTNYGDVADYPGLPVSGSGTSSGEEGVRRSLLYFDLSPLTPPEGWTIKICSAELRLYARDSSIHSSIMDLHEVTSAWEEMHVTWNSAPSSAIPELTSWNTTGPAWMAFVGLEGVIEGWANGLKENHGFMIKLRNETEGSDHFNSREMVPAWQDEPNYLSVEYDIVKIPASSGRIPDTGQTQSYTTAFGEDSDYTINPPSYTKLDDNGSPLSDSVSTWAMVKDKITGLIWEVKQNKDGSENYSNPHDADNGYTYCDTNPATNGGDQGTCSSGTDTEDFINALNNAKFGGFSDWRLPTRQELRVIVDYSRYGPTINTVYFQDTVTSNYWSSITAANDTASDSSINFSSGGDYHVGPVRVRPG